MPVRIPLIHRILYDPVTSCWNWKLGNGETPTRYGKVSYRSETVSAHRLAAHLWLHFDLKSKFSVLHRCDNPACFNPRHLFIGTNKDNTLDALRKGRLKSQGRIIPIDSYTCGHPRTEENTYYKTSGITCRQCRAASNSAYKKRKRLEEHCRKETF